MLSFLLDWGWEEGGGGGSFAAATAAAFQSGCLLATPRKEQAPLPGGSNRRGRSARAPSPLFGGGQPAPWSCSPPDVPRRMPALSWRPSAAIPPSALLLLPLFSLAWARSNSRGLAGSPHNAASSPTTPIAIMGLMPLSDSVEKGKIGRGVLPAMQLAMEQILNESLLNPYSLDLRYYDTEVSEGKAARRVASAGRLSALDWEGNVVVLDYEMVGPMGCQSVFVGLDHLPFIIPLRTTGVGLGQKC